MHLQTILIVFLLSLVYGQDRRIISKLNPDCPNCNDLQTLIYTKAEGPDDTIHQIWDFTKGVPTIIFAIGTVNSSMTIEWFKRTPINFVFEGTINYRFAAAIDKLYEYEDCHDVGHYDSKCPQRPLPLTNTLWTLNSSIQTTNEAMIEMQGSYHDHKASGNIEMKLNLLPFNDYAEDLPHLIHTANSTLIDIDLVNFTSSLNASRYAIHFMLVSTDRWNDGMNYTIRKSLDDEHTPGVFEIIEVLTPKSRTSGNGGFMQFRPVGYTEPERSVSSSTNAYISSITRTSFPKNNSTIENFYKDFRPSYLLVEHMFISFGLPGDGYYKQRNFTSWSFTYGYGTPPVESVSAFVIVVISIGLSVPILLAISGVTYVLVRRYKQRRNQPERFIDDE